ncbi:plexin-B3 isoform X2 [Polyodon spathula]|nr:plexin-B3 isoform X2 [Polyodon spathula]XP_041129024.1 plexin-B3 isoform X2 [Polyodon spathula]XP_041129025.1 plexin-B3 isoform X2 [Polyodon spathula]XP_041129026.1 plexin-B3 isoform X2 [Polyodon spathula]
MRATAVAVLLASWWLPWLPALPSSHPASSSFQSESALNHLLLDPSTGHLYVGAVDHLFHLSGALELLSRGETGPRMDSPDCLPPINQECQQATDTSSHNKLLLLGAPREEGSLIVCGTVFQGICEKRSLGNVSVVLYRTENPVDTQYVAANDPRVSTVGVVVEQEELEEPLLFVGRGYTSKGPGGVPPITTRHLGGHNAFTHEDLGKLVVGSYSEYNNHFVAAFQAGSHVYFVFFRRDRRAKREYRTYVSRLCVDDRSYYSYIEVPLRCAAGDKAYNLAQATFLSTEEGATLYVVMAAGQASTPAPTRDTALCAFPLAELDGAIVHAQERCYVAEGRSEGGVEEAYIEYEVNSQCARLTQDSVISYPCGYEHTPSPIASSVPVEATPAITMETQLSAVTVTTEAGHTIVLLGDSQGQLHKVFLQSHSRGEVYSSETVEPGSPVSADLLLDNAGEHIYVMTAFKVSRVPVSSCGQCTDCGSCLAFRDPHCGWCVLQGSCTRKAECERFEQANHWLWSYRQGEECVTVQGVSPANRSREEQTEVTLTVHQLPSLGTGESFSCVFGTLPGQPAAVTGTKVTCQSPLPEQVPPSDPGKDHVVVSLSLKFNGVVVAVTEFIFYDCGAVSALGATAPCRRCVSSDWECNWCLLDHSCTHQESCPAHLIIYNRKFIPNKLTPILPTNSPFVPPSASTSNRHPLSVPSPAFSPTLSNQITSSFPDPSQPPIRSQLPPSAVPPTTGSPASVPGRATPPVGFGFSDWIDWEEVSYGPSFSLAEEASLLFDPWETVALKSEEQSLQPIRGPDSCPCISGILGSLLVPVGFETQLILEGKNLDLFEDAAPDYHCVLEIGELSQHLPAQLNRNPQDPASYHITCQTQQYRYLVPVPEYTVPVYLQRGSSHRIDSHPDVNVTLYNCSVGQSDCSRCKAGEPRYSCVWCGGEQPGCVYQGSCRGEVVESCPDPVVHSIEPMAGPLEGNIALTIMGSNLGQRFEEIELTVSAAGLSCKPDRNRYQISVRIVCTVSPSPGDASGPVRVIVGDREPAVSAQLFTYQNPELTSIFPDKGPVAGGTSLTINGIKLKTGQPSDITAFVGHVPCEVVEVEDNFLMCCTAPANQMEALPVRVLFGQAERTLGNAVFNFKENPAIAKTNASKSFYSGGRVIEVSGRNLDVVQNPLLQVCAEPAEGGWRQRRGLGQSQGRHQHSTEKSTLKEFSEVCVVRSSEVMECPSPRVPAGWVVSEVLFILDNLRVPFSSVGTGEGFLYQPDPVLKSLTEDMEQPYHFKPGSVIMVEGTGLTLAMTRAEVSARVGDGNCAVKTLDDVHLYCEPPPTQPASLEGGGVLPQFIVQMGGLQFKLGRVQYDSAEPSLFPLGAQMGLAVGAALVVLVVLVIVFMYRRKSKQAVRDYKKVLVQLENLEINVGDQCRKEFTDLMTEMDLTSDLGGPGIPFLDYRSYAERVFFPGHRECPLRKGLDVPESRRQTVEQGLEQLAKLLNSKLFLIKFIHTLEMQPGFSQRDRGYVASLLTMALHGKMEYLTDIMKTLLGDLVEQYVAKNPKLMLRRTETVVEKLLSNWMSICLYSFLRDTAGEPLYMLYRAIKYQVDKGPVDAVSGKAKRTLNDSHLLREDLEYRALTLTVLMKGSGGEIQPCPVRVLDTDTITQVKEKILDQVHKGVPFSQRTSASNLDLEWRSGVAGHLTLSDDDVTAVVEGRWKRINTLQHYKVTDCATVALIPRMHNNIQQGQNPAYLNSEKTAMLEDGEEGGLKLWHLVKSAEEPEVPKHRKSSLRERERAKAVPEIFLTRLLSMKGTLQKFVDDVFQAILNTSRPVPIAVRYFFDFLDEVAEKHGIEDKETVHIWKTNSLPLRFWVNILKNPQFILDVQVPSSVDAILSVIAQTFIDSCTTSEHKVGRDSPVNKLLYAREIPRYKNLVEKYYSDIHQTVSGCYQEMNSTLTELSGNCASEMNSIVALHELYKYINKYYDEVIMALEDDPSAQKMQLAYRLQQVAALVENKVTDL